MGRNFERIWERLPDGRYRCTRHGTEWRVNQTFQLSPRLFVQHCPECSRPAKQPVGFVIPNCWKPISWGDPPVSGFRCTYHDQYFDADEICAQCALAEVDWDEGPVDLT